ncbi:MAG TPA: AMP-binding protein [Candidatus Acidoferrales bacterium]|nr:AMP-binding protein [Candidatus Acidoferrales bacterium]
MSDRETIFALLQRGAPRDVAIAAPEREPLTYGRLRAHVEQVVDTLRGFGITRNDRMALMLPNGPELASAFVAVAACAAAAPLNPAYRTHELRLYLSDLRPKALVVAHRDSCAIDVARELSVPVIQLIVPAGAAAGIFRLCSPQPQMSGEVTPPADGLADDVALVLHTSGTTSRPKMVPLSQRNLCASARHIRETLALTPQDRCLNIMPLFHIHGLMAGVLASLSAGASTVCTPGFAAFKFVSWTHAMRPTWYTAVPTMHQAIVDRAERRADFVRAQGLRFIRSSSAPLPRRVTAGLETVFGVPVIESYGMTEAAHQITSNPLPPGTRKPGTVGRAAGPAVAIMDASGQLLGASASGEVVIRGANVTSGYAGDPTASAAAFSDGWFRTGDQGVLDADGCLTIVGRLKEMINRGGEKISPREVDDVLMEHPAVAQAVTFAVPHDTLGEDVAAAVVLRAGASAHVRELRAFVAARMVDFKVPRSLVIVDEIPRGATGKLQRIGLAQKLGLTS